MIYNLELREYYFIIIYLVKAEIIWLTKYDECRLILQWRDYEVILGRRGYEASEKIEWFYPIRLNFRLMLY
jgi:hypothetical protein